MNKLQILKPLLVSLALLLSFSICAVAQDDTQSRSITSDDFSSQRPAAKKVSSSKAAVRRVSYKYVAAQKAIVRRKSGKPINRTQPNSLNLPGKISEIGVTVWRMREPRRSETNAKLLPVRLTDGKRAMWIPERVNPETNFAKGDRVRIAIESSVSGYLYVIDSETYADGSFGEPFLIFPENKADDNFVEPGLLVDIPDQNEDLPYFLINPKAANYTGELLTVVISPKPLTNLRIDKEGRILNQDNLIELEASVDVEIYSRTDAQDKTYTQAEADASCGSKNRQLVREKSAEKPCGEQTRQLTREEPLPQSIYRVKARTGQPAISFIRLKAGSGSNFE